MLKTILVLTLGALAGCESLQTRAPLLTEVRTVEVKVPVVQPCIDGSTIEALPPSSMPPRGSGVDQLANGAAVDLLRLSELARKQREMLLACSKLTKEKS